ncbi:FAD-dependent oxidoreductase [Noviherbaspirillum sp.]|uniref:FAD-dependent oxidoreductase n=1 Tax=Noviherbaspirillum sp. TaxID=1926288 RepID=UPI002B461FC1|nr:FAD-dependent oxidoreductase [Noviherbaspirillum sp.]HJV79997.1 FAD-dependent oxidoreductase [Noviherbaspirillum sp.]
MREFDVVVLGTGATGLLAALTAHEAGARVGLFEKNDLVGGTTAMSGGVAWLPNNPQAAAAGIQDSPEEALRYLESLSHGMTDSTLLETLVKTGPEMIDWIEKHTAMRFWPCKIPDYHPEHPGGKPEGGRSLEPSLFSFLELGEWADRVATGQYSDPETGDVYLSTGESPRAGGSGFILPEVMAERRTKRINGRGRALAGHLLKACLDRGIEPVTGSRARELVMDNGRVTGVIFEKQGEKFAVRASKGVVIATGGFEFDKDLVKAFLRGPMHHPASLPSNTGDGLRMAMRAGAMLGNMREAWWVPVLAVPGETRHGVQRTSLVLRERSLPGAILVNQDGVRFCNEAANYNALGGAFHQFDPVKFGFKNLPCWLVFDQAYLRKYGFWEVPPGGELPEWVARDPSLAGLAGKIGIDADNFKQTVARWNANVSQGRDPDFQRGDSAYDGWNGDNALYPDRTSTLGPVIEGPFYAVQLHSSTLGTKGGPQTDARGAVLDVFGKAIPGLYAAGNAMAGVTGMVYGGAGGTLGPAMTFGYLAGRAAATAPTVA